MSRQVGSPLTKQCESPEAEIDISDEDLVDADSFDNNDDDQDDDEDWPDTFWTDEPIAASSTTHAPAPARKLTSFYPSPPLGLKPRETRLLRLLPGSHDDVIRCSLSIQSLADGLSYEGLSYTWGRVTRENVIMVNEHPMQVTDNLFSALKYLRQSDRARILWIDAICMNQQSIEERNHQVTFMSEIYRTAAKVLIWLGEGTNVTGEQPTLYSPYSDPSTWTRQHQVHRTFQTAVKLTLPSWWKRAWTVQEYVVARSSPVICFRDYTVRLDDSETITRLREHDTSGFFTRIDELIRLASIYNDRGANLLEAARLTADCQALDRRDKVYSVLGLLKPSQASLLKPDYSMSVAEVYARATRICLTSNISFALFPVPRINGLLTKTSTLVWEYPPKDTPPSWAMNYSEDNARLRFKPKELEDATSFANVSLQGTRSDTDHNRNTSISKSYRVLHCYIYPVGVVNEATGSAETKHKNAVFVQLLASKMSSLFHEVAVGRSAMAELHDDFARRYWPTAQHELQHVKGMVREGFRQKAYPYHLVKIVQMLDRALDISIDGRRTLFENFSWYVEGRKTLGTSGATFLGNAMRRRLLEHCFEGWQDEGCVKWLHFRDMGVAKEDGNGALICTEQSQFGIAEAVAEKGDVLAVLMPSSKTILLKPRVGKDGITRYQYKGFVYLPAIKQYNVEDIAIKEIELF